MGYKHAARNFENKKCQLTLDTTASDLMPCGELEERHKVQHLRHGLQRLHVWQCVHGLRLPLRALCRVVR